MQIIVRKAGSEASRKKGEAYAQILKHYYGREIREGSRFWSKAGSKNMIRRIYD